MCVAVIDSGSGIPEKLREKIMLPFFSTKNTGGVGLGLSISRSIVESHGGRLFLDPQVPHTCFIMELPKLATVRA